MKISRNRGEFAIIADSDEMSILIAGLRETLQELENWEFSTRVGYTEIEVQKVLDLLLVARHQADSD